MTEKDDFRGFLGGDPNGEELPPEDELVTPHEHGKGLLSKSRFSKPHHQPAIIVTPGRDMIGYIPKVASGIQIHVPFCPEQPFRMSGFAVINSNSYLWRVHSVHIGNYEQLAIQDGDVPEGLPLFMFRGRETSITFMTTSPGTQILITMSHLSKDPIEGEVMLFGCYAEKSLSEKLSALTDVDEIETLYTQLGRRLANKT